jgi:hypothetical protein
VGLLVALLLEAELLLVEVDLVLEHSREDLSKGQLDYPLGQEVLLEAP